MSLPVVSVHHACAVVCSVFVFQNRVSGRQENTRADDDIRMLYVTDRKQSVEGTTRRTHDHS